MSKQYNTEESVLLDLRAVFIKQKWFILASTLLCTLLALSYFFIQKPSYIAEASVWLPSKADVVSLNVRPILYVGLPAEKNFTIVDVYTIFRKLLISEGIKRSFFNEVYLPGLSAKEIKGLTQQKLYNDFLKQIKIKNENPKIHKYISTIIFKANTSDKAKKMINNYISFVNERAMEELTKEISIRKRMVLSALSQQIAIFQSVAGIDKIEQKKKLEEIFALAKKEGIKTILVSPSNTSNATLQVYRKNLERFKQVNYPIDSVKMFNFNDEAHISNVYGENKLKQLLLLGILGGLILGFFMASLRQGLLVQKSL